MTLGDGVRHGQWTARRVPAGAEGAPGATSLGTGPGAPVTFPSPRKGTWSVEVTVEFERWPGLGQLLLATRCDVDGRAAGWREAPGVPSNSRRHG